MCACAVRVCLALLCVWDVYAQVLTSGQCVRACAYEDRDMWKWMCTFLPLSQLSPPGGLLAPSFQCL